MAGLVGNLINYPLNLPLSLINGLALYKYLFYGKKKFY